MNKYLVRFSVDGRSGGEIIVEAPENGTAKRIALGDLQGRAGYENKKIRITGTHLMRN